MVPLVVESGIIFFCCSPLCGSTGCYFSKIRGWYVKNRSDFSRPPQKMNGFERKIFPLKGKSSPKPPLLCSSR